MTSIEVIIDNRPLVAEVLLNEITQEIQLTIEESRPVLELTIEQVLLPVYALRDTITGETPAGVMDGSNATFSTARPFIPETLDVFLNGLRLKLLADYTTSGNHTILLYSSPSAGENLLVNYQTTI